jgi:hypothetical protein
MMNTISVEEAVRVLNSAAKADPKAMDALISARVPCNETLANHPTIQVQGDIGEAQVGLLGILNGLFGINHSGRGHIEAIYDGVNPSFSGFRVGPTKDLPA